MSSKTKKPRNKKKSQGAVPMSASVPASVPVSVSASMPASMSSVPKPSAKPTPVPSTVPKTDPKPSTPAKTQTKVEYKEHKEEARPSTSTPPLTGTVFQHPVKDRVTGLYPTTPSCAQSPFTAIINSGKDGVYSDSCAWIAMSQAISLANNTDEHASPTPVELRTEFKFPPKSIQFVIDFDKYSPGYGSGHNKFMQAVCNTYNVEFHIYIANYTGAPGSTWIGNSAIIFTDEKMNVPVQRKFAIINYGGHYELIVSKTPSTPRHQLRGRPHWKLRSYSFKECVGQKPGSKPDSKPDSKTGQKSDHKTYSDSVKVGMSAIKMVHPVTQRTSQTGMCGSAQSVGSVDPIAIRDSMILELTMKKSQASEMMRTMQEEYNSLVAICNSLNAKAGGVLQSLDPLDIITFKKSSANCRILQEALAEAFGYERFLDEQIATLM
ncbi:hypothetical protein YASMINEVIRUS_1387 [Yasminevirus sp. GU-2018]|uniref:Uncharacterized protein n=1 Tax=Yasminevirus sp. GU-2018 TaxID=2420051 RepID=A0A5K0UAW3_9VIRU|nr:hypothetical protein YASMINEVIRUS_1387 [Yasminevirus sp. GU-2018]